MHHYKQLGFLSNDNHVFSQLLIEDLFGDKIKSLEIAKDFNRKTKNGDRKDMGQEAFKIWCRTILQKIVKPNYFIMVSANLSEINFDHAKRHAFGQVIDGIFELAKDDNEGVDVGFRIEELVKRFLPELLRKGTLTYFLIITFMMHHKQT